MAVFNVTVTPKTGPDNRPLIYTLEGGMRVCICTLTLPTAVAYAAADRCRVVWANSSSGSSDFLAHYGQQIVKQIVFVTNFSDLNIPSAEAKGEWSFATQRFSLIQLGVNAASNAGIDEAEVPDATQINGTCRAEAMCFF